MTLGKEMTDDEAERFINQADRDNDGQVSLDEFTFIMMKITSFEWDTLMCNVETVLYTRQYNKSDRF